MILYTTDYISGKELYTIGLVSGATVQSKSLGKDFGTGIKSLFGGELKNYTELMNEARNIAISRMIRNAHALGAEAIIGVRFSSSELAQSAAEIMVYGTAVKYI